MRKHKPVVGLLCLTVASTMGVTLAGPTQAVPSSAVPPSSTPQNVESTVHDMPNPLEEKRRALRQEALSQVISGQAKPVERNGSTVVKVGETAAEAGSSDSGFTARSGRDKGRKDQYVELGREKTDKIFVVLAEFGNERATDINQRYGDIDTDPDTPGPSTFEGPLHNAIPEPDRSKDNSTVWQADYSADYFRDLYFGEGRGVESLKTYYEKQSSGRYSVDGMVTDWVKVKYNEARYGRSDGFPCASNVCSNTWFLLKDALDVWVADKKAAGATDAAIKAELASYDVWDRYDYNGNGNFDEPDGYIDHFQVVHAGGDQADGDPYQGEDAIWSHRWRAFQSREQGPGPANFPIGGVQIGNTGLWVADYTIQPENGGLSVFAHEYGHDLGLPDHYDTAGGGDNAVNWWTLMAQSRVSAKKDQGIGTRPADLGAWDKLQLGWFDYEVVPAGVNRTLDLGPHEYNSAKAQGVIVPLPDKQITTALPIPPEGTKSWYSGTGDDINNSMTRSLAVPAGTTTMTFQTWFNIEDCGPDPCDYAYVEANSGSGWTTLPGSITKTAEGNGIDGFSGGWVPATFDLSSLAGQTAQLRVRYQTDGAVAGQNSAQVPGIFVDDIRVTNGDTTVFADGAEAGANGWTLVGFSAQGATRTTAFDHFYLASNRQHVSYDKYLKTGPYNFGFPAKPDWVEHFPYQEGLLVTYWDTSFTDNNESQHPGQGLVLPIDAHPAPIYNIEGNPWRGRIQTYDAPFSTKKADSFTLHVNGKPSYIRGQAAQPVFDDRRSYWNSVLPNIGVKVPNAGVRIQVLDEKGTSMRIRLSSTK